MRKTARTLSWNARQLRLEALRSPSKGRAEDKAFREPGERSSGL